MSLGLVLHSDMREAVLFPNGAHAGDGYGQLFVLLGLHKATKRPEFVIDYSRERIGDQVSRFGDDRYHVMTTGNATQEK